MMGKLLLSWALLLTVSWPVFAHPITDSAEMSYSGPVSVEESRVVSPDDLSLSEQAFLSQGSPALGYSSLPAADIVRDGGLRTTGYVPREAVKEVGTDVFATLKDPVSELQSFSYFCN
nr:PREDICTED: prepro-urotensin II-beta-like [Lepisosteus oculatus]